MKTIIIYTLLASIVSTQTYGIQPLRVNDIEANQVIGRLGKPIGEIVNLEGELWQHPTLRTFHIRVLKVNNIELKKAVLLSVPELTVLPKNKKIKLTGSEELFLRKYEILNESEKKKKITRVESIFKLSMIPKYNNQPKPKEQ